MQGFMPIFVHGSNFPVALSPTKWKSNLCLQIISANFGESFRHIYKCDIQNTNAKIISFLNRLCWNRFYLLYFSRRHVFLSTLLYMFLSLSKKKVNQFFLLFQIFNKQNRIKHVFEAKGIPFEEIDLCQNQEARDQMREKAGIPDLLPPAIFNDDNYCGVRYLRLKTIRFNITLQYTYK